MPNAVTVAVPFHSIARSATGFAGEGLGESAKNAIRIEKADVLLVICRTWVDLENLF